MPNGGDSTGPGAFHVDPAPVPNPIVPATTSVTAVIGTFPDGPLDQAVFVSSRGDVRERFGGDDPAAPFGPLPSLAVHAVTQFFTNGGTGAWIVRVPDTDAAHTFASALLGELGAGDGTPRLDAIAFDLMCVPETVWLALEAQHAVLAAALRYCEQRGAVVLADPPAPVAAGGLSPFGGLDLAIDDVGRDPAALGALLTSWGGELLDAANFAGAAYYPWIEIADADTGEARLVPPSGSVAGVYARTDAERGVWKAPAGTSAGLRGVSKLADSTLGDSVGGVLNAAGVNCLRTFPQLGTVVWGARTMAGADRNASDWKYVNVRRLYAYLAHSIDQSTQWAVFEPNEEPLWAQVRLVVGRFMNDLFRQGAFQGRTEDEGFFVRCDATTTSVEDRLAGRLTVVVGFAPLRPAEFVTLRVAVRAAVTNPG